MPQDDPFDLFDQAERERIEDCFGRLAVERGLLSETQLEKCRFARESLREEDPSLRLGEVMMYRGYLTKAQALEILKAAHKELGHHRRIGGYELDRKLGEGAMGAVYRARQISMDRLVALKLLPQSLSSDETAIERFLTEARSVARLNHPSIIRGFEVGEANGYHYFAMEYVEGQTAARRLRKRGPVRETELIEIATRIAEALHHAHQSGIIHRDVKPDNIMLGEDGTIKLADLGLARREENLESHAEEGPAIGTPHYMAPEQVEGASSLDGRTDLYALGATLFHLGTGRPPFEGQTALQVLQRRLHEDPPAACAVSGRISRRFSAVLLKLMSRDRANRYADGEELLADLKRLQNGQQPLCMDRVKGLRFVALQRRLRTFLGGALRRMRDLFSHLRERLGHGSVRVPAALTTRRALGGTGALLFLAGGIWIAQRWDRIRGPQHPDDPSVEWSWPPEGVEPFEPAASETAWRATRAFLYKHADDEAACRRRLTLYLQKHPDAVHAAMARRLLRTLPASEQSAD
jgi:serine/threonine-protein kinase